MERHLEFWPERMPRSLPLPQTGVHHNLKVSAERYPEKTAIAYYGTEVSYQRLLGEAASLAGYLQGELGVSKGDRVILYLQNSPQFAVAFYAVLQTGAVVVPVNPMLVTEELEHYVEDSGARVAVAGRELYPQIQPLVGPERAAKRRAGHLRGLSGRADGPRRALHGLRAGAGDGPRGRNLLEGCARGRVRAGARGDRAGGCGAPAVHLRHHGSAEGLYPHPPHAPGDARRCRSVERCDARGRRARHAAALPRHGYAAQHERALLRRGHRGPYDPVGPGTRHPARGALRLHPLDQHLDDGRGLPGKPRDRGVRPRLVRGRGRWRGTTTGDSWGEAPRVDRHPLR